MQQTFNYILQTRKNYLLLLDSLSLEQINTIPAGFNNNIAWNFGHIIVSVQGLCYRLSGLPQNIEEGYINKYKKGTAPTGAVSEEEVTYFKSILFSNIEQLKKDYEAGLFTQFQPYTTSFGNTLNNIQDAVSMVQSHDALHLGYALALRRALLGNHK